ncbi:RHS repeat-associated core domain-containing protein [Pelomonas sp. CA6]|uniref:RHS repeat domain-containing protein n=1 Tax=Pelomonas sp. CA6 TaxID=2907999 RepID=UPI001F4BC351|nr:RHS repeat-associated core domain-containing protein [Pelomonas sp. CA6]MCH7342473.1 RHS repeat-associated core domain-containing protein [Pelomonas sp. CA6]
MPTLITDRFGNWVRYTYDAANPWQLLHIEASDGRRLSLSYEPSSSGSDVARIAMVSDGVRTWRYRYDGEGSLKSLVLPDSSQWLFDLEGLDTRVGGWNLGDTNYCSDYPVYPPPPDFVGRMTHPSGAVGRFVTRWVEHQRYQTTSKCEYVGVNLGNESSTAKFNPYPSRWWTQAIAEKQLHGPGVVELRWTYQWQYGGGGVKHVLVGDPQARVTRYTYGATYNVNEAQQLSIDEGWDGSAALRTTLLRYRAVNLSPYIDSYGVSTVRTSNPLSQRRRPVDRRERLQQGVSFVWEATAFDTLARPVNITRSNTLGLQRSELIAYHDHLGKWILSQVASTSESSTNAVLEATTFSPASALPENSYEFGKLKASYAFNPDGTLLMHKDGAGNTTTYSSYKRGLPQHIGYADGSSESAVVNELGLITSLTNAAGYTTGYGYDAMGRLNLIVPPSGDPVAYNATAIVFEPVNTDEFGLAAGHWRQTLSRGNARTVTYFDGLWRPVMQRRFDASDEAGTRSVIVRAFDADGRTVYESYPQRDVGSVNETPAGKRHHFDALGRNNRSDADSELGLLSSTTDALGGFQTRNTNARGIAATSSFWVLDDPEQFRLAGVSAAEGVTVVIGRDLFGKPLNITRSGVYNGQGISVTRRYVYDSGQRLCKTIDPESGATVQDYDAAHNIAWRAPGQNLPDPLSCDTGSVGAEAKISYGYTPKNQLQSTRYGDGSPGITRTYTPDGLPWTVVSNGSTWTYGYNRLRLPVSEVLNFGGQDYVIGWGVDANGSLSSISYPGGRSFSYSPNALGQARQLGPYASKVSFHPNGAVAGFVYGNSIQHSLTLNVRGLPLQNRDGGVIHDQYSYDANGNVVGIADLQESIFNRSLGYDGLDRLTSASAPNVWGSASYGYDPVDNLRSAVVGVRNSLMNYDTTNRLVSMVTNGGTTNYSYDASGNLRAKGLQTFTFDLGNRLSSASLGGSYTYDGLGRRIRLVSTDGSTRIQVYSQGGQLLWASSAGGARPPSSTAYIYLGGKQIAESSSATGDQYVHTDTLGSPVAHTNALGSLMNRTRYEPYGYTAAGTKPGAATSVIGFTGHVNDAETDLVYMQQRYYDPIAGRFLSVDPIVTDTNTGNGFGRYVYTENNPLRYKDPDGLKCSGTGDDAKCTVDLVDGKAIDRTKLSDAQKTQIGKIESALTTAYKGALANAETKFSLQQDAAGNKGEVTGKEIAGILKESTVDLLSKGGGDGRMAEAGYSSGQPGINFFSKNIEKNSSQSLKEVAAHESIHLAREFKLMPFRAGDGHNKWFDPAVKELIKISDGAKK